MGRGAWMVAGIASWLVAAACSVEGPSDDDGAGAGRPPGPTEVCEETCASQHPEGEDAYRALRECLLCRACANVCEPSVGALCTPQPSLDGCSAGATSCEACVASACALQQQADTTFIGACAVEGLACQGAPGCVALNNCVANCLKAPPTTSSGGAGGAGGA